MDVDENPNEVQATKYVTESQLKTMFKDDTLLFTPWFKLICQSTLFEWWESVVGGKMNSLKSENTIRRMLEPVPQARADAA